MGERRYSVIGLCCVSALLGGMIGGWMGRTKPVEAQEQTAASKVVAAEEFRLLDSSGRVRAALDFSVSGQPALTLRDEQHVSRVSLSISDETGLAVRDVDGKTRLVLSVDREGAPSLVVRDRNHRTNSFHPVK
jgi:hypothetical protein